jgi:hypothetical protein
MVPFLGWAATAGKGAIRAADAAGTAGKSADGVLEGVGAACRRNSFDAGTLVLMADGSRRPIQDVKVGDEVIATDPESGEQAGKRVTHVWVHQDDLFEFEIDDELLVTTEDHPFWSVTDRAWEDSQDLAAGESVLTADGRTLSVTRTVDFGTREKRAAYNLTVAGLHTYHVGTEDVLVHNCGGMDVNFRQVQGRIAEHVVPLHGAGTPAAGTKFADDIGEGELFNGLLERLDPSNMTGKTNNSGNHQHILNWRGAGAGGESRVEVWMTPNGELGGMWPVK